MKTKEELKLYFENGDKPTQEHFWAWLDSYWHKDEKLDNKALDLTTYEELIFSPTDSTEVIGIDSITVFHEGIKTIGGFQFALSAKNRISRIQFPSSLQRIRSRAFMGQYLTGTLKIPGTCKVIESAAFSSSFITISELILENGIETIEDYAFQFSLNKNLTDLYIPNSVKSVGQNAFTIPSLVNVSAPTGLDLSKSGIPITTAITYR